MGRLALTLLLVWPLIVTAEPQPGLAEAPALEEVGSAAASEPMVVQAQTPETDTPIAGKSDTAPKPQFRLRDELEAKGSDSSANVVNMLMGLGGVLALILGLAWLSKKFNISMPRGNSSMQLVSAMSVGQKEKLILVEVEGERLLLGVTPNSITKLKTYSGSDQAHADSAGEKDVTPKSEFMERFSSILKAGAPSDQS